VVSARAAITLRYLAIVVPLLVVFTVTLDLWLGGELREGLQAEIGREADLVTDRAKRELARAPDRDALVARITSALEFVEHPTRVRDARGLVGCSPRSAEAIEAVLDEPGAVTRRADVEAADYELLERQVEPLTIEVAASRAEMRETLGEFQLAALGALLATIVLAGGGGYLLAASALRPVDEIARTAARIDARSLDARLPARAVKDELGRLVDTLNRMLERIEQGVQAARRFTQDASHELKTPIAAIKGTTDVALIGSRVAGDDERAFQAIAREGERLERIVRDLLTIARADAGALVEQRERLDLRVVLDEVAEVGEILAQEHGASLHGARGDEAVFIVGDLARLRQVGLNLVDNAIRYGKKGGNVWIATARAGSSAVLTVDDDGAGIPEGERERVFARFHRGRRDVPGVGLGLAIARAIVEGHRGTLVAGASPRGGARFTATLPLA
jgi:signal transduction histidine kinase